MRKTGTFAAAVLIAVMGACSNAPTLPTVEMTNADPQFDSGFTMGSGNSVAGTGEPTLESDTSTTDTGPTETATASGDAAAGDAASRSAFTMGSGN